MLRPTHDTDVVVLARRPIRTKLQIGLGVLMLTELTLFVSAYYGLYSYRALVKDLNARSAELPITSEMLMRASDLRVTLCQATDRVQPGDSPLVEDADAYADDGWYIREQYRSRLGQLVDSVEKYRAQLDHGTVGSIARLTDDTRERRVLAEIDLLLADLGGGDTAAALEEDWLLDLVKVDELRDKVETLCNLVAEVPGYMHEQINELAVNVRAKYRTAIITAWLTLVATSVMLVVAARLFYKWIAQPLQTLVEGSREVARGKFDHRIAITTEDEMAELAEAMNAMTARFRETRDDLDQQVQERTNQVVRSEQLASVGFLAAGVAHEINNPLASIAMCSESLEGRLSDALGGDDLGEEVGVAHNYLQMIQREAFRCKQITEKLLDFARMGDSQRHRTDLRELVGGVIEMVQHVGKYQDKNVELLDGDPAIAEVSGQEIKQVVLNLVTNALESVDQGGRVTVEVSSDGDGATIAVADNGCGMTEEVRKHLFEPFFTRRRTGQGIGLGLSITYRIVQEHRGTIEAESGGAGQGSRFVVSLPVNCTTGAVSSSEDAPPSVNESSYRHQAA
ncbi:MAG: HAMP domain-containing sensor histidine kinase [Planctomycetota bacterium]